MRIQTVSRTKHKNSEAQRYGRQLLARKVRARLKFSKIMVRRFDKIRNETLFVLFSVFQSQRGKNVYVSFHLKLCFIKKTKTIKPPLSLSFALRFFQNKNWRFHNLSLFCFTQNKAFSAFICEKKSLCSIMNRYFRFYRFEIFAGNLRTASITLVLALILCNEYPIYWRLREKISIEQNDFPH